MIILLIDVGISLLKNKFVVEPKYKNVQNLYTNQIYKGKGMQALCTQKERDIILPQCIPENEDRHTEKTKMDGHIKIHI
jgi:hypothetical protein